MSAKERLKRFRDLQALATRLQVALIEECDLTRKQVDEIEESIADGEARCRASESWDGKQPDALVRPGKAWIAPTKRHIGKMVRVGNSLDGRCPDTWEQAELANVVHTAHGLLYFTKGTKGESVCWNVAWIEADGQDLTDRDGKGYISIQVDGVEFGTPPTPEKDVRFFAEMFAEQIKQAVANTKQANKPEQQDPLIDGLVGVWVPENPACTPKVGDWVRVRKPANPSEQPGWGDDGLDGNVCCIREVEQDRDGCDVKVYGSRYWLSSKWLTPCDPPNHVSDTRKMVDESRYREPTMADVVFGPSEVECTTADPEDAERWHSRLLVAILPETFERRFICQHPGVPDSIMRYKHARIKVS